MRQNKAAPGVYKQCAIGFMQSKREQGREKGESCQPSSQCLATPFQTALHTFFSAATVHSEPSATTQKAADEAASTPRLPPSPQLPCTKLMPGGCAGSVMG